MTTKMKRNISEELECKIKNNLVESFKNKAPKSNITRDKIGSFATDMMMKIEKENPSLAGSQKREIVFGAFSEILTVLRETGILKPAEFDIIDSFLSNQELFDSIAQAFKLGYKQIMDVVKSKKGFGCCSG